MRSTPLPVRYAFGPTEREKLDELLDYYRDNESDFGYQGRFEDIYNGKFADFMGGGFADSVATGTLSIFVAIAALKLPKQSEVIVSPITDPGTLSAIIFNGLTPRLADSTPGSYNMGPEEFLERISESTSAVVVVHAAGQAAEIDTIVAEAHKRNIKVLEDCSQAHGARFNGKLVGTFGDIAAFSTMYRKAHITGACGGTIYTQDRETYHRALAFADRGKPRWEEGFDDRDPTQFLFPALNLHQDEISSAIGIASLARLPDTISKRRSYVAGVSDHLRQSSKICSPYPNSDEDSPFIFPIIVDLGGITCSKIDFAEAVRAEGIGLNPHYMYVVSEWPWVQPYLSDEFQCPNARDIRDTSFNLYLNENYGDTEVTDTVNAILKVEAFFAK